MAITEQEIEAYLSDHLPYELAMLDYAFEKILELQPSQEWNAHFECFAVHARNLYEFLTNGDGANAKACEFITHFSAGKSSSTKAIFPKLLEQVFHLSPRRPSDDARKVQLAEAGAFRDWINKNFSAFYYQLSTVQKSLWRGPPISRSVMVVPPGQTASTSSNIVVVMTTFSSGGGDVDES